MGLAATITGAAQGGAALVSIFKVLKDLYVGGKAALDDARDGGVVSLPTYIKPLRLCSRVYIDEGVYSDPVITDVIKTVHTQYAAFVLTALQMNQFVTRGKNVQDMLKVVATEDNEIHLPVVEGFFGGPLKAGKRAWDEEKKAPTPSVLTKEEKEKEDFEKHGRHEKAAGQAPTGKIVSLAGDNHVPAGKLLEVTLTNPENDKASVTVNLMVQLAPYKVPAQIAVEFLVKDVIPAFYQRMLMWRTGEISFWRDLVAMSDVVERRERLRRMDPTGIIDDVLSKQQTARKRVFDNLNVHKAERARNIANSVLIFSRETVQRAKAMTGIDITNPAARDKYFATAFAMMIVVVDTVYNQVTFYYNGIDDAATFSFDQMSVGSKGGGGLDLVSVMNALNQGRGPRF